MVRLVKGAYWDTEIKRAQERGLDDYPVFTRKAMTDLNYIACARQAAGAAAAALPAIRHPQRADRRDRSRTRRRRRRFRIPAPARHGRGAVRATERRSSGAGLPDLCAGRQPSRSAGLSGAAPAGERRQFLLRGARRRRAVPVATLLRRPADIIGRAANARHPNIPLAAPISIRRSARIPAASNSAIARR